MNRETGQFLKLVVLCFEPFCFYKVLWMKGRSNFNSFSLNNSVEYGGNAIDYAMIIVYIFQSVLKCVAHIDRT